MSENKFDVSKEAKQYGVYKKSSALRLRFVAPKVKQNGDKEILEEGFIYLEIAPNKEFTETVKTYKWETDKIGVKLGMPDLQQLGYSLSRGVDCQLFHKFGETTKTISLKKATEGKSPFFIQVSQNASDKGGAANLSIPISAPEAYAISKLIDYAIPKTLNW